MIQGINLILENLQIIKGFEISFNLSILQFDRETKLWVIIWKPVEAGTHIYQKQHKTFF